METQQIEQVVNATIQNGEFKGYNPCALDSEAINAAFEAKCKELKETIPEFADKTLSEIATISFHEAIQISMIDSKITDILNGISCDMYDFKKRKDSIEEILEFKKRDYQKYVEACKPLNCEPVNFRAFIMGFPLFENDTKEVETKKNKTEVN